MIMAWTYKSDGTSMQHDDTTCTIYSARVTSYHMHHLPTSDITRSSQDQIKLGINNIVVIIKWPQGAWSLPTILAQHHEYTQLGILVILMAITTTTNKWLVILTAITTMTSIWSQTVIFLAITTVTNTWSPTSSSTSCQSVLLKISTYKSPISHSVMWVLIERCDLVRTHAHDRGRGYR